MGEEEKEQRILSLIAKTIRGLSIDAIEKANSGHPGLPLGCAEIGAYLYSHGMRHNPENPSWINRDRFILSAGHGSMLLYACLHLSGYPVSLEDIKNFRQYGSCTPGHPEYWDIPGIETTTGPLGQGIGNAVGIALGNKIMAGLLNVEQQSLLDACVFALAGDGCMMEGISSEACSLAGHLKLDNLIVIYDSNDICLDGATKECFTEDVAERFHAYGWSVTTIDGHDIEQIHAAVQNARQQKGSQSSQGRPSLIIAKTIIGKGSPHYAGTSDVHGKALGAEEVKLTKKNLGIPIEPLFYVPDEVANYFKSRQEHFLRYESEWQNRFEKWQKANPENAALWDICVNKIIPNDIEAVISSVEIKDNIASRQSSHVILQTLYNKIPFLVGGSADLSGSDMTMMKANGIVEPGKFAARNIKYGVREFAMGAIVNGLSLQGMIKPFCGTFLVFSDYMRNSIRLAALMKLPNVYQFTHDSIFLGEDGPTHQPVEHVASLRAMPGLTVIRPADADEVKGAWITALKLNAPTALILSRQKLPSLAPTSLKMVEKGGYILKKEPDKKADYCLLASGSEVSLALDTAEALEEKGFSVRLVSMPSFELFDKQDHAYQQSIIGGYVKQYCSIEAGVSQGWYKYVGEKGITISINEFGISAPADDIKQHFGFTVEQILEKLGVVTA
ncbi:transketolase [Thermoproteota archaeon]